jgi:hypothetical protein
MVQRLAKAFGLRTVSVFQSTYVNFRVFGPPDVCEESFEAYYLLVHPSKVFQAG